MQTFVLYNLLFLKLTFTNAIIKSQLYQEISDYNVCINGTAFKTVPSDSLNFCLKECLFTDCNSFNYNLNTKICDLFDENKLLQASNLFLCKSFYKAENNVTTNVCFNSMNWKFRKISFPNKGFAHCPIDITYLDISVRPNINGFNMALGRSAMAYNPSSNTKVCAGVDGNINKYYNYGGCFCSFAEGSNPNWYLIDLADIYRVLFVTLTNMLDINACGSTNCDKNLEKYYVGLFKEYTSGNIFKRGTYPLCGQFQRQTIGLVNNLTVNCIYEKIGRYILIQTIKTQPILSFCEVEVFGNYIECVSQENDTIKFSNSTYPDQKPFSCPIARNYPNIENPAKVNLALGRQVVMSSITASLTNQACNAVDGDANADASLASCVMTNVQAAFTCWILVDLGDIFTLEYIIISNLLSTYDDTLVDLVAGLFYFNAMPWTNQIRRFATPGCGQYFGPSNAFAKIWIECNYDRIGRYVVLFNDITMIAVCEIEVFGFKSSFKDPFPALTGTYPDHLPYTCPLAPGYPNIKYPVHVNIALGRPVYQSSYHIFEEGTKYKACYAVDGNGDGSACALTYDSTYSEKFYGSWILVDLQSVYSIDKVVASNSQDNPKGLYLLNVGILTTFINGNSNNFKRGTYPLCGIANNVTIRMIKVVVKCARTTPAGRYVLLQQDFNDKFMRICETEVYKIE